MRVEGASGIPSQFPSDFPAVPDFAVYCETSRVEKRSLSTPATERTARRRISQTLPNSINATNTDYAPFNTPLRRFSASSSRAMRLITVISSRNAL
jgi:hypothetical protein